MAISLNLLKASPITGSSQCMTTSTISRFPSLFVSCSFSSISDKKSLLLSVKPISSCLTLFRDSHLQGLNNSPPNSEEDGVFNKDIMKALNPSMPYANIMCFKGGYNAQIFVGENEPDDSMLRRFRREVMKAGVIQECRRRKYFETKQDVKKRKSRDAARRNSRRRTLKKVANETKPKDEEEEEEDDNWDLPDEIISF
eukprot:Gb_06546 [translate_table: standard]